MKIKICRHIINMEVKKKLECWIEINHIKIIIIIITIFLFKILCNSSNNNNNNFNHNNNNHHHHHHNNSSNSHNYKIMLQQILQLIYKKKPKTYK